MPEGFELYLDMVTGIAGVWVPHSWRKSVQEECIKLHGIVHIPAKGQYTVVSQMARNRIIYTNDIA